MCINWRNGISRSRRSSSVRRRWDLNTLAGGVSVSNNPKTRATIEAHLEE
jgi:hypothetical protein